MTIADLVYEQVKTLPDPLARQVLDFIGFLRDRQEREQWRDLMNAQAGALARCGTIPRTKYGTMLEPGDLVLIHSPLH